ncbi:MAG: redoxin domain-containing protein [Verrucomicrobiae bacterium]|nr:redoxin domain-containing protein [Verrucomicrobiae bacterium]
MSANPSGRAGGESVAGGGRLPVLALVSLGLGVLGMVTSVIVVGAVFGVAGLVAGGVHLRRGTGPRGLGWAGVTTSGLAVGLGLAFALLFAGMGSQIAGIRSLGASGFEAWHGRVAPDFEVTTLDGRTMRLESLKGRRVILDFWATWCPPCVKEIPHFIRLHEEYGEGELVILGISGEDESALETFVRTRKIPYPVASADGAGLPAPFSEVRAIPTTFFLDREGIIRHVAVGYHDLASLRAQVEGAGRPMATRDGGGR